MKRYTLVEIEISDQVEYDKYYRESEPELKIGDSISVSEGSHFNDTFSSDQCGCRLKFKDTTDDEFRSIPREYSMWFKTPSGKKYKQYFNSEFERYVAVHIAMDQSEEGFTVYYGYRDLEEGEKPLGWRCEFSEWSEEDDNDHY